MPYFKYDGSAAAATSAPSKDFYGTSGVDTLTGASGNESFWGGQGDRLVGGAGDDTYYAASPRDVIVEAAGGGADMVVTWQSGALKNYQNIENLKVDANNAYAAGDAKDNVIEGGAGSQQLYGGLGQDVLVGGAGKDIFIVYKGEGNDVVQDFNVAEDVVRLQAGFTNFAQVQAKLVQVGADVKLDMGGGDGLMFRNVQVSQLSASNFQLQLDTSKLGELTFSDEFSSGLSIWDAESNPGGVWRPDYGYSGSQGAGSYTLQGNGELQIYTSPYFRDHAGDFKETPFVSNGDGTLSIWARPSTNAEIFGYGYTSGLITTKETFSQQYGYFEIRADLPDAAGAWPAFWLLPADGSWPPELDVIETLTVDPNATYTTVHSSVDPTGGGHSSSAATSYTADTASGFHTYGALWTATDITWYIDGVEVFRTATPADMNKPMYLLANLAMGGWGGPVDPSKLPAEFKIDYIRAYALGDGTSPGGGTGGNTGGNTGDDTTGGVVVPDPVPDTGTGGGVVNPPTGDGLVLTSKGAWDVLTGGAGTDTIHAGEGYDTLTGGAGADHFVFGKEPWAPVEITDFQLGTDKLDLKALLAKSGYTGTDPVADGYVSFRAANGGVEVLFDRDAAGTVQQWPNRIITLDGVSLADVTWAKLTGGSVTGGQTGGQTGGNTGGGTTPPPATTGGVLTSKGAWDVLNGGAGADTINAGEGYDTLTGGAGGDSFVFGKEPWAPVVITDFHVGEDRLDLSALLKKAGYTGADPVADGYVKLLANNSGGVEVFFDRDGAGTVQQWPNRIITLEGVAPADATWAKLTAPSGTGSVVTPGPVSNPGAVLTSKGGWDVLSGGGGDDTINAGMGYDTLTGGAGDDHFVFGAEPWAPVEITDFTLGEDVLDLSALFDKAGYTGTNPIADKYLHLFDDGDGGVKLMFDRDGAAAGQQWPNYVIHLDDVSVAELTSTSLSGWVVM